MADRDFCGVCGFRYVHHAVPCVPYPTTSNSLTLNDHPLTISIDPTVTEHIDKPPRADPTCSDEMREMVLDLEEAARWAGIEASNDSAIAPIRAALLSAISRLTKERDRARGFVAFCMADGSWMGCDIDGGDAQDKAEELGLIVEVPADEDFRAEYDCDTMYVLAWGDRARLSVEEPSPAPSGKPTGGTE